ncbi:hypothetical protein LAZ67_2005287 [Cordylochernes scorpioides]|uniref:Uncharacterized protein n=1 Tax=Cordylochernes scorpioides TaxID=51811 RepID=A0ABY6K7I1_9ARAC|nr:hypothetical protein LAZ67_2005287 [Cordylochernes scorpioides]
MELLRSSHHDKPPSNLCSDNRSSTVSATLTKKSLKSQLKIYIRSKSEDDRKAYALLKKKYSSLLTGKKKTYYNKYKRG